MGEEADALYGLVEAGIEECENYFRDRRSTFKRPHGKIKHPRKTEATMPNAEALKRALAAVNRTYEETNQFDGGGWASGEIMNAIRAALRAEFAARPRS